MWMPIPFQSLHVSTHSVLFSWQSMPAFHCAVLDDILLCRSNAENSTQETQTKKPNSLRGAAVDIIEHESISENGHLQCLIMLDNVMNMNGEIERHTKTQLGSLVRHERFVASTFGYIGKRTAAERLPLVVSWRSHSLLVKALCRNQTTHTLDNHVRTHTHIRTHIHIH